MTTTGPCTTNVQRNLYISVHSTANLLKPVNFSYTLYPTYKLEAPRIDFTSPKMMLSKGSEIPKPPLPIKQDAQFYSRLLSVKDTSLVCPSFSVYYGVASGAVPFLWESQPGIPKHAGYSTNTFMQPPLSPPPSYFSSTKSLGSKKQRSKMFDSKRSFQKFRCPSPSLSSSSSSASSSSSSGSSSRSPVVKCLSCFRSNAA